MFADFMTSDEYYSVNFNFDISIFGNVPFSDSNSFVSIKIPKIGYDSKIQ
jgi:hypothetical protein